ncbi:centromere protein Q isoform X1 [Oncorhynchus tshawytscha]|uniref:Centromere protein Q n=2 Tax=Oncorhynchus tshawytscha TaxID=74940 RepID=A0AAZ3RG02_ONCTS|nr:centromere protein Q isoform X1 [Oncorhynchus tshawytscha]XP_042173225.1 centromere protein Q isoform X1 [Oncorhynchus tshawytscha]
MRSALIALSIMAAWSGLLAAHNACAMITNKCLKEIYRETVKIMKPVRGSERASSKAPKGKKTGEKPNKPGIKTRQRRVSQEEPQPGTSSQIPQPKPQKKKKGGTVASPRKLKGQEKWKPLTKSSITALDNILGLSILSVLAGRRTNKEESQKHLNIVKNRFLSKLAQLSVPIQKQEIMSHSSRQHQEETRKSAVGKKILNKLVAELGAVVGSLEQLEKERDSLEHQCFNLRQQLEQQEESNQQILQLSEQGVLRLPPVPQRKDRPLQEQMVCLVHSRHSVTTARRLAKTLQTSGPVQDAQTLLERAYRHADRLITPPTAVSQ